jgi:uncharacterized protein (DUF1330 family)
MIFVTQLIYIKEGQEAIFDQFEAVAIPAIAKYNGQLLFRVRPADASFIEINMEKPYEIHLGSFPSEVDLENFMHDEDRQKFLHLKEQSIRSVMMIKGEKL